MHYFNGHFPDKLGSAGCPLTALILILHWFIL